MGQCVEVAVAFDQLNQDENCAYRDNQRCIECREGFFLNEEAEC